MNRPPPFARVLIPMDDSPSSDLAWRRSEPLLTPPDAKVILLGVVREASGVTRERLRLQRIASEMTDLGATVEPRVRIGRPDREIVREARDCDLVLLTCPRRPLFPQAVLGSTSLSVLRGSPAPVLLYRPLAGLDESFFAVERSEPARFRRILVMLDGSVRAERILESAERLGQAFGSELILFQALDDREDDEDRRERAHEYLSQVTDAVNGRGLPARLLLTRGEPATEALKLLDGPADTLALVTRGHTALGAAILGSVASRLLRTAEGPILCIAPPPSTENKAPSRAGMKIAADTIRTG